MSYKMDEILTMLDEVLMRLDRIEKQLNIKQPSNKLEKPKLTVVKSNDSNIVEFDKNE